MSWAGKKNGAFSEEKRDVINNVSCPFVPCGLFVISWNKTLYGEFMAVCVLRVFYGLRTIFFLKKGHTFNLHLCLDSIKADQRR